MTKIETARLRHPLFFADWDKDPYQTFLKILHYHYYGFPNISRDDYRDVLEIALDALGYWELKIYEEDVPKFMATMNQCFSKFIEDNPQINESNRHTWLIFMSALSREEKTHPVLSIWVSENLHRFNEINMCSEFKGDVDLAIERAIFAVSSSRGKYTYPNVESRAMEIVSRNPYRYRCELKNLYKNHPGNSSDIFKFLPAILKSHRRILHATVQRNRGFRKSGEFKGRRKKFKPSLWLDIDELNNSIYLYLLGVMMLVESYKDIALMDDAERKRLVQISRTRVEEYIILYSVRCPFPPIC